MRLIDADALDAEDFENCTPYQAQGIIDDAPTVDAAPIIYGVWTLHKDGSGTCNRCRFTQRNVWDYDSWQNYCGHCGAKMDNIRSKL